MTQEPLDMLPGEVAAVGDELRGIADAVWAAHGRFSGVDAEDMPAPAWAAFEQVREVLHRGLTSSRLAVDDAGAGSRHTAAAVWATDEASTVELRQL